MFKHTLNSPPPTARPSVRPFRDIRVPGLTRGNLSSHMSKLEAAAYIEITKEFVEKIPRTLLRITENGRSALHHYIQNMTKILDEIEN